MTVTTVAGFASLLSQGRVCGRRSRFSVAGGVVGATFLALSFVPAAFLLLGRRLPMLA